MPRTRGKVIRLHYRPRHHVHEMNSASDRQRLTPHEAQYANVFRVGHRPSEMFLEFGLIAVEEGVARWHTCIVTSPLYAKDLLNALTETLQGYEAAFGPVPEHGDIEEIGE